MSVISNSDNAQRDGCGYTMCMITHIIDFIVDYVTNFNLKKLIGGIIVLIGLASLSRISQSADASIAVLYAIVGIFIGGIGFVIIYFDMAKTKVSRGQDDHTILAKSYEQQAQATRKPAGWHMDHENPDTKTLKHK